MQCVDEAVDGDELVAGGFAPGPLVHKLVNRGRVSSVCKGAVVLFFPGLPGEGVTTGFAAQVFYATFLALCKLPPLFFISTV